MKLTFRYVSLCNGEIQSPTVNTRVIQRKIILSTICNTQSQVYSIYIKKKLSLETLKQNQLSKKVPKQRKKIDSKNRVCGGWYAIMDDLCVCDADIIDCVMQS